MNTIRSLLVATDFSRGAGNAVQRAGALATASSTRLALLHVVNESALDALRNIFPSPSSADSKVFAYVQRMLHDQAASLPELDASRRTTRVVVGKVLEEILLASEDVDLLVVGAHGATALRDLILGTTAERLVRKGRSPVLVAKRPAKEPYKRVLVPVDFSPHSAGALKAAACIAPDADVTLIHAFEVPFEGKLRYAGVAKEEIHRYRVQARQEALSRIRALRNDFVGDPARIFLVVQHGDAPRIILDRAEEMKADLIVINRHAQSIVEELFLGSVTRHVLSDSRCDVLVVHDR